MAIHNHGDCNLDYCSLKTLMEMVAATSLLPGSKKSEQLKLGGKSETSVHSPLAEVAFAANLPPPGASDVNLSSTTSLTLHLSSNHHHSAIHSILINQRCSAQTSFRKAYNPQTTNDTPRLNRTPTYSITPSAMDNFRKIDIDQYDEDVIQEYELVEPYPKAPEQALADAKAKSTEVRTLIGR